MRSKRKGFGTIDYFILRIIKLYQGWLERRIDKYRYDERLSRKLDAVMILEETLIDLHT